ncbi:uncharacterized protein [Rutidosis leptorrhynchoides]|uniref:uncharacterized protein isoform X2 n=1 Tax=Rutidosis leptorrhynchoides TaxID=125765 RepID=UPI003A991D78
MYWKRQIWSIMISSFMKSHFCSTCYFCEFEYGDYHRSFKSLVALDGRMNKCSVASPCVGVGVKEIEPWAARLLFHRWFNGLPCRICYHCKNTCFGSSIKYVQWPVDYSWGCQVCSPRSERYSYGFEDLTLIKVVAIIFLNAAIHG